jgi:hypothetical protein
MAQAVKKPSAKAKAWSKSFVKKHKIALKELSKK